MERGAGKPEARRLEATHAGISVGLSLRVPARGKLDQLGESKCEEGDRENRSMGADCDHCAVVGDRTVRVTSAYAQRGRGYHHGPRFGRGYGYYRPPVYSFGYCFGPGYGYRYRYGCRVT
jgi:hypothetical protein